MTAIPSALAGTVLGADMVPGVTFDVGVDIDDVLHPWADAAHALCEAAGITNGRMYDGWKMWEAYGCEEDEWVNVVTRAVHEGGLYDVPPIPGAVEALRRLMWLGHRIHLVTARGFVMVFGDLIRQHTLDWLEEYAVPHTTLTFEKDKPKAARALELDFFIDDAVHNFEALRREAPNTETYLLTARHNRDFETDLRLETMDEFAAIVIEAGEKGRSQ